MKKGLLLSALLIFACTDDDASNEENTNPSNEKLIESVTFSSVQTCLDYSSFSSANTTNCNYNSDDLLTSFKFQNYDLECPNELLYDEQNSTIYIEHFDGYIMSGYSMGELVQIDLNANGYIDTIDTNDDDVTIVSNIVYDNGYISSLTRDNGSSGVNYIYQNGNLIRAEDISDDSRETVITYTTFENKSKLFHPLFGGLSYPYVPLQNYYGKNNTNLPLTRVSNRYYEEGVSETTTTYYNYSFDNEGYVTFLEIRTFIENEYYNIDNSLTEVTLEITYTN